MTSTDFRRLSDVLPEPMLLTFLDGRILAANEAATTLLNRKPTEITGLAFCQLTADPPETVSRLLTRFARSGQFVPGALSFLQGVSGSIRCRVEGALVQAAEGPSLLLRLTPQQEVVSRFVALSDRITNLNREVIERRQAAETFALLSAIVDSCDDAIISKDLDGVVKSWNKSAERLFGYTADEAIGQSIALIIPQDRLNEELSILEELKQGERVDHFETIRVRKDGAPVNVSVTISPVRDGNGRIVGASKVARDLTARIRQEHALEASNAALKRANEDLQQFAYSASHDLQEPLRMVATYSELLRKRFGGRLGAIGDEYIGYTLQGALRLESLLKSLRTYIEVSTTDLEAAEELESGEVLEKTLSGLEVAIHDSGATIHRNSLPRVRMREFELDQVFQNLIGNAIRYRSGAPPCVTVAARPGEGEWLFSVQDNGMGIEPQFSEQIFGIFKRLHSKAEYPGTGMGLAICRRIIERAGGRIWVESEPGRGSTFYFTVPMGASTQERYDKEHLAST